MPLSIGFLTALQILKLGVPGSTRCAQQEFRALKTLLYSILAMRSLILVHLTGLVEDDVLAIGRSLKAWPLPCLDLHASNIGSSNIGMKSCWQALELPPEASN